MNKTIYGLDYGMGQSNIDKETGIRFGVISQNSVLQVWADLSEVIYPKPEGYYWSKNNPSCSENSEFATYENFEQEPSHFEYDKDGYKLHQSNDDTDIFVIKSPYFTYATLCSPCAPGACSLCSPIIGDKPDNNKCYCLDMEWFDESYEPCPYPYWSVETGELMYDPKTCYIIFNETDCIPACPEPFDTRKQAEEWIKQFKESLKPQGYYLTSDQERIPIDNVEFDILEAERENPQKSIDSKTAYEIGM